MILTADEVRAMRSSSILGGAGTFWAIVDDVCAEYGVTPKQITSKGRGSLEANEARGFVCLYALRRGLSSVRIGKFLNRDHSTVLHAAARAQERVDALAIQPNDVLE